jgi:phage terminase large subunit
MNLAAPTELERHIFGSSKAAAIPRLSLNVGFNWKTPDFTPIFEQRAAMLQWLRENPGEVGALKDFYAGNEAQFINDWGITFDPRNAERKLPTLMPFLLFDKQVEWIDYVIRKWRAQEHGLTEKSRDCGVTWLAICLSCTLCLFNDGLAIGFGSRKEEYVDKVGTIKPILPKGRMFMEHIPEEFRGSWVRWRDAPHMRINFPDTGSIIVGEAGDQIGRGDRESIYFVDEAAYLERPQMVEYALSQTTNCRQDISSVNGMANPFAQKRFSGRVEPFIFDWRDDPRKDEIWYQKQVETLDPVVVAQEVDRDYSASVAGIVIPAEWVRACVDACQRLGIEPQGAPMAALDVADEGVDKNAICGAKGVEVQQLLEWSGRGSDIFDTTQRAVDFCDLHGYRSGFRYDADGLGAGVRGDARTINEARRLAGARPCPVEGWRGSGGVIDPEGIVEGTKQDDQDEGRKNKDYFANRKAQGWWSLRRRIQKTYLWVRKGKRCHPDEILSISSQCPLYAKMMTELSQATYKTNGAGKIVIYKNPDGMASPNLADAVMMRFALGESQIEVSQDVLKRLAALPPRRRFR